MGRNWKEQRTWDRFEKTGKMHRSAKKKEEQETLEDSFVLSDDDWNAQLKDKELFAARVVEVHKRYAFISPEPEIGEIDTRDVWLGSIARRFLLAARNERNVFAVGDRVICRPGKGEVGDISQELPQCTIEFRAVRTAAIKRVDPMHEERRHVIAANMEQLIIVASFWAPKVKWGLIDRYLVLAEEENIPAVVILNKVDLLEENGSDGFHEICKHYMGVYEKLGIRMITTQANAIKHRSKAWKELVEVFDGKISLLSGHSGVGKSSLVNLLRPEIEQDVESEDVLTKGRHTTSYASLIKVKTGGYVIDTPGIRSFDIAEHAAIDLTWAFRDLRPYLNQCKYRECQHIDEPECAVRTAVAAGDVSEFRYRSYLGILTGASGREGRTRDLFDE